MVVFLKCLPEASAAAMSGKRISLSAYKKNKALAVAPKKKERRLGFGESVSTREVTTQKYDLMQQ